MSNTTKYTNATTISPPFDLVAIITAIIGMFGGSVSAVELSSFLQSFWSVFVFISYAISALLLYGIIYSMIRFDQLFEEEQQLLREQEHAFRHAAGASATNTRWKNITDHGQSENPNDWRLAIIEADIMLDEALNRAGYLGASIGDKLKSANPDSFKALQDAWTAHKIRNQIAHQGADFVLTKRITQETINQYERALEELGAL